MAIAGWLFLVICLYFRGEDNWDRYSKTHHCKKIEVSELWTYVPVICPGCPPMAMSPSAYQCDGEIVAR